MTASEFLLLQQILDACCFHCLFCFIAFCFCVCMDIHELTDFQKAVLTYRILYLSNKQCLHVVWLVDNCFIYWICRGIDVCKNLTKIRQVLRIQPSVLRHGTNVLFSSFVSNIKQICRSLVDHCHRNKSKEHHQ